MKKIRIISLGEIVTPNFAQGIAALTQLAAQKKSDDIKSVSSKILAAVGKCSNIIEKFKLGELVEDTFNQQFIETIRNETGIMINVAELDEAWSKMNPFYANFSPNLKTIIDFNKKPSTEIILLSYTNPKDMRRLQQELQDNQVPYKVDDQGNLSEIAGIKLYITYAYKTTKANLLKKIINEYQPMSLTNNFFNTPKPDIKYVHGVNNIQFEQLRKEWEGTQFSMQKIADDNLIETIVWDKQSESLVHLLDHTKPLQGLLSASKL